MAYALLISVFIIASCGLVYELIAGTLSSYLLGDSVTQLSTVIGVYLPAMGLDFYLSRYIVYLGAPVVSLLFPLALAPRLGLVRTNLL